MSNLSAQMETETKNLMVTTLYGRLKRYLRHFGELTGEEAFTVLDALFKPEGESQHPYVLHLRSLFPTLPTAKALQADPRIAIPAMHTMLRHFEGAEPDKRTRLFSMLPTKRGFRAAHITICSTALRDLLRSADIRDDDFMERKRHYWSALFEVEKFERGGRTFGCQMQLDGKAVSILMTRPKRTPPVPQQQEQKKKKLKKSEDPAYDCRELQLGSYDRVLGLDPGRRDLFVAVDRRGRRDEVLREAILPRGRLHQDAEDDEDVAGPRSRDQGLAAECVLGQDGVGPPLQGTSAVPAAESGPPAGLPPRQEVQGQAIHTVLRVSSRDAPAVQGDHGNERTEDSGRLRRLEQPGLRRADQEVSFGPGARAEEGAEQAVYGAAGRRVPHQQAVSVVPRVHPEHEAQALGSHPPWRARQGASHTLRFMLCSIVEPMAAEAPP